MQSKIVWVQFGNAAYTVISSLFCLCRQLRKWTRHFGHWGFHRISPYQSWSAVHMSGCQQLKTRSHDSILERHEAWLQLSCVCWQTEMSLTSEPVFRNWLTNTGSHITLRLFKADWTNRFLSLAEWVPIHHLERIGHRDCPFYQMGSSWNILRIRLAR